MAGALPRLAGAMWTQSYLETCCRSALHRLTLADPGPRPDGLKDAGCLERLAGMGLAVRQPGGGWRITPAGWSRHATEVARMVS